MKVKEWDTACLQLMEECLQLIMVDSVRFKYMTLSEVNDYDFCDNNPLKFTNKDGFECIIIPYCNLDIDQKNIVLVLDRLPGAVPRVASSSWFLIETYEVLSDLYKTLSGKDPEPCIFNKGNFPDRLFKIKSVN